MVFLFIILFAWMTIFAHEIGHAYAMRKQGIGIEHIHIGLPVKYLSVTFESRFGCPITLGLLPFKGEVKRHKLFDEKYETLPRDAKLHVDGGGIAGNYILALAAMVGGYLLFAADPATEPLGPFLRIVLPFGLVVALAMFRWHKFTSVWLLPALTVGALLFFYYGFSFRSVNEPPEAELVLSTYGITGLMFLFCSLFSAFLGLINMLPFWPMDGWRLFATLFREKEYSGSRFGYWHYFVGLCAAIATIVLFTARWFGIWV